jgi:FMN reductase
LLRIHRDNEGLKHTYYFLLKHAAEPIGEGESACTWNWFSPMNERFNKMRTKPLIVGMGGTMRPGSSTELAVRYALRGAEQAGADTAMLGGSDLILPLYNPIDVTRSEPAQRLIDLLRNCDGLILGSPGYHGSISGLVKNALDYTEDMRDDARPYLDGRAIGCIACAFGWQSVGSTLASLRSIVHALRAWPTPFAAGVNSEGKIFCDQGRPLIHPSNQTFFWWAGKS